eukprot:2537418-Amphidinium_carterae.1
MTDSKRLGKIANDVTNSFVSLANDHPRTFTPKKTTPVSQDDDDTDAGSTSEGEIQTEQAARMRKSQLPAERR